MEPTMGIDRMMPALYKAAVEGKPQDYHNTLRRTATVDGGLQVTPNGNTVLHVAALRGHQHFVEKILDNHEASSSLLFAQNKRNQTALHCAAKKGYANIVSILIWKSKEVESGAGAARLIQMTDNVMGTAMHEAVRMGHLEVVKLLVQEDAEFVYPANNAGETPIYIAAKSGFHDCLKQLLDTCKYPTYGGPLGQNALHATVLSSPGCMELLMKREISLCEMTDDSGWTPLHYAIKNRDNKIARMILEANSSAFYIWPRKGDYEWTTVFHMSASYGNVEMVKYMSNNFPDCWMMLNCKCQNVLHEAVLSHRLNVIKYVLENPHINNLIDEEDEDDNTPLDLLSISSCNPLKRVAMRSLMWKHLVFNKELQTPFGMALENKNWAFSKYFLGWKSTRSDGKISSQSDPTGNQKGMKEDVDRSRDIGFMLETSRTNIIVPSLILTMTFAAGLTVPGGYNSTLGKAQGTPILLHNWAFQIFVLLDLIAFICSILSILYHIVVIAESSSTKNYKFIKKYFTRSTNMLIYATMGAVNAFISGMYATLAPSLQSLAAAVPWLGFFSILGIGITIYIFKTRYLDGLKLASF